MERPTRIRNPKSFLTSKPSKSAFETIYVSSKSRNQDSEMWKTWEWNMRHFIYWTTEATDGKEMHESFTEVGGDIGVSKT